MATKAAAAAKVPTFVWLDTMSKVPLMGTFLSNIRAANTAGASPPVAGTFVVYDLPDRDCAALASNGEYSIANGGVDNYKKYIDAIKALLVSYSDVKVILVIGKCKTSCVLTWILIGFRARFSGEFGHQYERS
jgi:cellulose 1,4-beta-cellobiosidase